MKKKAFVLCDNHLDLIWRRGFEKQFEYGGGIIRPYVDIEEELFDRWIHLIENTGCIYSIEQSLSVKKYLERNPDMEEKFAELVKAGKIRFYGGGESVIDTNLVDGESIVRNHLYSILWLENKFGVRPEYATARDTFGMSSQLPQIFRKLGYYAMFCFAYSGKPQKQYWKGLNGDLLFFLGFFDDIPGVSLFFANKNFKVPVCTACMGRGCRLCDWSGFDYSHTRMEEYAEQEIALKKFIDSDDENIVIFYSSEEIGERDDIIAETKRLTEKYGIELFLSHNMEFMEKFAGDYIERLKQGNPLTEHIDPRTDWNPACTGIYVTRIKMKQLNRELENALLSCEKLAVFAADYGMVYPAKKLERLWSQLSVLQFHDGVTSSHSDGAYYELLELCSNIAMQTARTGREAMKILEKNISVPYKEKYLPFIMFNPLAWEVKNVIASASFTIDDGDCPEALEADQIEVIDLKGNRMDVYEATAVKNYHGWSLIVKFKNDYLPSMGYKTFYLKIQDHRAAGSVTGRKSDIIELKAGFRINKIENEFYRVDLDGHNILGIFDKKLGEFVMAARADDLTVEDDIGSPWETLIAPILKAQRLCAPYTLEMMLPADYTVRAYIRRTDNASVYVREGVYINKPQYVEKIIWKQTLTLYDGLDRVDFATEIDWKAERNRLRLSFPLPFKPENDAGYYEIPYGIIKREAYKPTTGGYTCKNGDWPALNFVACRNEEKDYTVALLNKGIPGYCIRDGAILLSILRSPREYFCAFNIEEATDPGRHFFEYSLVSGKGSLEACDIVRKGREFNTVFMNHMANAKPAGLPSEHSFLNNSQAGVVVSSVKRAEDGSGIIVRAYEAYGKTVSDSLKIKGNTAAATECDLLENQTSDETEDAFNYAPFEIKTLKIKK